MASLQVGFQLDGLRLTCQTLTIDLSVFQNPLNIVSGLGKRDGLDEVDGRRLGCPEGLGLAEGLGLG